MISLLQEAVSRLVYWFSHMNIEEGIRDEVILNSFLLDISHISQTLQELNCKLAAMLHTTLSPEDLEAFQRLFLEVHEQTRHYTPTTGTRRNRFRRDYVILIEAGRILRSVVRTLERLIREDVFQ